MDAAFVHQIILEVFSMGLLYAVTTFAFTKFFEIKNKVLFWVLRIGLPVLLLAVGDRMMYALDIDPFAILLIGTIVLIVVDFVIPLVMCHGRMLQKLLITIFIAVATMLAQALHDVFFTIFAGDLIDVDYSVGLEQAWENPLAFGCSEILGDALIALVIFGLYALLKRRSKNSANLEQ